LVLIHWLQTQYRWLSSVHVRMHAGVQDGCGRTRCERQRDVAACMLDTLGMHTALDEIFSHCHHALPLLRESGRAGHCEIVPSPYETTGPANMYLIYVVCQNSCQKMHDCHSALCRTGCRLKRLFPGGAAVWTSGEHRKTPMMS
jgi:hypothetical protein